MFSRFINRTAHRFAGIDFMDLVPRPLVKHEAQPAGQKVILLLPRFSDRLLGTLIQPRLPESKKFIRMALDQRGSWLWLNFGQGIAMGQLVTGFQGEFPDDSDGAAERLSGYLFNMWENKLIEFVNLPPK